MMQTPKFKAYVTGFVSSLVCTFVAYVLVVEHISGGTSEAPVILLAALVGLALAQFAVQLRYFLHLGEEARPRWKLLSFGFMILIVGILVAGSLWIMANLNYHTGTSHDAERSIIIDEGLKK